MFLFCAYSEKYYICSVIKNKTITLKHTIMKTTDFTQVAKHFIDVYSEEVENNEVTSDMISEWWGMTCDQYGYSQEEKDEVEGEVKKSVWSLI